MSDDRIRKLESIDFQWIGEIARDRISDMWHKRFQELKKFKETHEDCNVSKKHGHLSIWVTNQRSNYRLLKEGTHACMSDDRIRKLESIGFCWSCQRRHDNGGTYHHTIQTMIHQIRNQVRTSTCCYLETVVNPKGV